MFILTDDSGVVDILYQLDHKKGWWVNRVVNSSHKRLSKQDVIGSQIVRPLGRNARQKVITGVYTPAYTGITASSTENWLRSESTHTPGNVLLNRPIVRPYHINALQFKDTSIRLDEGDVDWGYFFIEDFDFEEERLIVPDGKIVPQYIPWTLRLTEDTVRNDAHPAPNDFPRLNPDTETVDQGNIGV